jgi:predicted histidine transporter YuiF (NhaC family)
MRAKKMIGISLMVALAGAFIAWNIQVAASSQQMIVSALLALAMFAAWRFLVWQPPRKK